MFQNLNRAIQKIDSRIIFFALVLILFFLNFYTKTFFYRPSGMHQWRQADCLSITKNYYEEGLNFFQPKIHFQGVPGGKAVSECPILNYTVACLWRLFGEHEFIYRLIEYLLFISAMYVLFTTLLHFFKSSLLAFFSVGFFLTSPLLVFYSANFIADAPALSLCIISLCHLYRFYHGKRLKYFYYALIAGTLAILMKASALMGISLLFFFTLADLTGLNRFLKTEKLFQKKLLPALLLAASGLLIVAWYRYALYYNDNNNNNIFLLTILPIWEMQEEEVLANLKILFSTLFPVFHNRPMFFLFFALIVFVIAKFRALDSFLKYAFVFSALFFFAYLLFFYQVFTVHDYYLTNLMIFPVVTFLCTVQLLSQSNYMAANTGFVRVFMVFYLLFNAFHAAAIYRLRMIQDDKMVHWFPFVSEDENKLAKYLFWDYGNTIGRIENITPELRTHGITREDQVLSIPDQSFNISLYFMDQKGFTIARHHLQADSLLMDRFFGKNIKYVVVSDTIYKRETAFKRNAHRMEHFFMAGKAEVLRMK